MLHHLHHVVMISNDKYCIISWLNLIFDKSHFIPLVNKHKCVRSIKEIVQIDSYITCMSYCFYSITQTVVYIWTKHIYTTACDVGSTSSTGHYVKNTAIYYAWWQEKIIHLLFFLVNKLSVLFYDHMFVILLACIFKLNYCLIARYSYAAEFIHHSHIDPLIWCLVFDYSQIYATYLIVRLGNISNTI